MPKEAGSDGVFFGARVFSSDVEPLYAAGGRSARFRLACERDRLRSMTSPSQPSPESGTRWTANVVGMDWSILDRMEQAVAKVRERLLRATAALNAAGVPYAVVGGNAVASW